MSTTPHDISELDTEVGITNQMTDRRVDLNSYIVSVAACHCPMTAERDASKGIC